MTFKSTLDESAIQAAYVQSTRKRSSGIFWKPESGQTRLRVLPGWNGATVPFIPLAQHYLGGEENKRYTCLATAGIDQPCIICKTSRAFKKLDDPIMEKLGDDIQATKVWLWNVLIRGKESEGIKTMAAGWTVHSTILACAADKVNCPNFLDPYKGFDILIEKSGSGMLTKYACRIVPSPCALAGTAADIDRLFNSAPDLSKYLTDIPTTDEMKEALKRMQGAPDDLEFVRSLTNQAAAPEPTYAVDSDDSSIPPAIVAPPTTLTSPVVAPPVVQASPAPVVQPSAQEVVVTATAPVQAAVGAVSAPVVVAPPTGAPKETVSSIKESLKARMAAKKAQ